MAKNYYELCTFEIHSTSNVPFSALEYSLFKFGDEKMAKKFGKLTAEKFISTFKDVLLSDKEIIVLPSPYSSIPTASGVMAKYFKQYVNKFLYKNNRKSLLEAKIHRYKTYSEDYGTLTAEERLQLISKDTYHFDSEFLNDRFCIFLDDIKITGSHEKVIKKLIEESNIEGDFCFLYWAAITNKDIPAQFENELNYHSIKILNDLTTIINKKNYSFNTRTIKFILISNTILVKEFIEKIERSKLKDIFNLAISNNYHLMDEYRENLTIIKEQIKNGNKLRKRTERIY